LALAFGSAFATGALGAGTAGAEGAGACAVFGGSGRAGAAGGAVGAAGASLLAAGAGGTGAGAAGAVDGFVSVGAEVGGGVLVGGGACSVTFGCGRVGGPGVGSSQFRRYGRDTTTTMASTVRTRSARNHPAEKMLRRAISSCSSSSINSSGSLSVGITPRVLRLPSPRHVSTDPWVHQPFWLGVLPT